MEFRQLEYFMEVAKREHMTDAAEELHVSQSSVSRSIYNLEEELGVKLFIREGKCPLNANRTNFSRASHANL